MAVRAFLSYAHQSDDHAESVRRLWMLLRSMGVDAKLDVTATAQRQQWTEWMNEQVREADFVLVIASPTYRERAENRGDVSAGRGVRWEARQLQERFYADQEAGLREILPVILPGDDVSGLPDWLLPASATHYRLREITEAGVESLYRVLTAQPLDVEPPLGEIRRLSSRTAPPVAVPPRPALATELTIDVVVDGPRLTSEVFLAGAPVCRREADLPPELTGVWQALSGPPAVARDRLTAAGLALAEAVFDEAGRRVVADVVAGLRPGDEVQAVWRAEGAAAGLPVELIELTTSSGRRLGPLALVGGVSVRRQARAAQPARRMPASAGPLRILAAVAAPEETRTANTPLDVEAEMQALLDAMADPATGVGGQVRILEVASLPQIKAALGESDFHVLHLSAHGSPDVVELEDEDGDPKPVSYRELMDAVKDTRAPVPLIVLSSCAGAAGGEAMAAELIAAGADRVVAMQAPVTDEYATRLLAAFYRELIACAASDVAGALARARREVERARRSDGRVLPPEYAVATLLCADRDTPLIDTGLSPVELTAQTVPSGTSVRELALGQLIGRRAQLREATAALRRTAKATDEHGFISGVQLVGVGGIGKTALAGRLVTRLRDDGVRPVIHEGRWNPTALFAGLAAALDGPDADRLASAEVPDTAKVDLVGNILESAPVVLVFDDFERNLSPGGGDFLDPAFDELFTTWCARADTGLILVTSRYSLPGEDRALVEVPVGPLSRAELRRLLLRLPALRGLTGDDLRLVIRTIGGHPRLIEYVDALLRGKRARFREVQAKLKALAEREGIDLGRPRPPGAAVEDALLLGGADILLDELVGLLTDYERELLLQIAVSRAPMTLEDLAYALREPHIERLAAGVERLSDLTLLTPGPGIVAHPWTAELLERRPDPDRAARHARALQMIRRTGRGPWSYEDAVDGVRHLVAIDRCALIADFAQQVVAALPGVLAAAAYLAEIRPLIPRTERAWSSIAKLEYEAVRSAGDLAGAHALLVEIRRSVEDRRTSDPEDPRTAADMSVVLVDLGDLAVVTGDVNAALLHYHEALDLGPPDDGSDVTWWQNRPTVVRARLGDIAMAIGDMDAARDHFQAGLEVSQRLAAADPDNTEWQRYISISRNKLGDVAVEIGDLATAREHFQACLEIRQRLAAADPDKDMYQRDLSASRNRLGIVAMADGDFAAAREHFEACFDLSRRLADADPGDSGRQRDLLLSRGKLGEVAYALGDLAAARSHFQASLEMAMRLVAADPANSNWQRDLSIVRERVGILARVAGDLPAARRHFQAAEQIRQRLAGADPNNRLWQHDLAAIRAQLAGLDTADQ
ncbi:hypothetical protein Ade02nite_10230 [Paractinoplanes deccanensis]|uniref:SEFIR domain-containing protein n=1 Tax=Paractinoplanes deccanensis TaxID=113561 RepID=A0ABQ3XXI5_9ACTN|nr:hypothetical protein Ade02nite_10230 [Actinoplanes deccanensis]